MSTRVFIYARVSTKEQTDGGGFDRQVETCKRFCEAKGWFPLRVFREQESGSVESMERPELAQAIELCAPPSDSVLGVEIIVVERPDRIARDLMVGELFYRECRTRGIKVYAADSGEELVNATGDPTRTLIRQMLGALSQWVKSETVKKLQAGRRRKKELTGKPCGGPVGYGFDTTHPDYEKQRRACEIIVDYHFRRGNSFSLVALWLDRRREEFPPPGKRWSKSTVATIYHRNAGGKMPDTAAQTPRKTLAERLTGSTN